MRKALEEEFPTATKRVKRITPETEGLREEYFAARRRVKIALLELAAVEMRIKKEIGFSAGLETTEGTFLWTKATENRGRIQWMRLVSDMKIPDETLAKYRGGGKRRNFFFSQRKQMREVPEVGSLGPMEDLEDTDETPS